MADPRTDRDADRDLFAAHALTGWIIALGSRCNEPGYSDADVHDYAARYARATADAMLAERDRTPTPEAPSE